VVHRVAPLLWVAHRSPPTAPTAPAANTNPRHHAWQRLGVKWLAASRDEAPPSSSTERMFDANCCSRYDGGMTVGVHRTETEYVWPETLLRPSPDVRLVYLDLNHWIYLAKAATRRADGVMYREPLETLRAAKASGRFGFPLSATHIMEMAGIRSPRQRFEVAAVMEELSGFATLVDRVVVMKLEFEAAIDAVAARRPKPYANIAVLGQGCLQAVGRRGGLRIRHASDDGEVVDVTEERRLRWPGGPAAFDKWQADAELTLDRALLRGPTDAEVPELQAMGWDPTVAGRIGDDRAKQEEEQAARLTEHADLLPADPQLRRGRIRDAVAVRYAALEAGEMLNEALAARGLAWTLSELYRRLGVMLGVAFCGRGR
jgi:hypothetical protein